MPEADNAIEQEVLVEEEATSSPVSVSPVLNPVVTSPPVTLAQAVMTTTAPVSSAPTGSGAAQSTFQMPVERPTPTDPDAKPSIADFYGGSICLLAFFDILVMGIKSSMFDFSYAGSFALAWVGFGVMSWRRSKTWFGRVWGSFLLTAIIVFAVFVFARLLSSMIGRPNY